MAEQAWSACFLVTTGRVHARSQALLLLVCLRCGTLCQIPSKTVATQGATLEGRAQIGAHSDVALGTAPDLNLNTGGGLEIVLQNSVHGAAW